MELKIISTSRHDVDKLKSVDMVGEFFAKLAVNHTFYGENILVV